MTDLNYTPAFCLCASAAKRALLAMAASIVICLPLIKSCIRYACQFPFHDMTGRTDWHTLFGTAEGPGSEPVFICNLLPFPVLAGIFHHQFNVMLFTPGIIVKTSISCISRNHFRVFSELLIVGFDGWDEVMNVIAVLRNIYCPDIAAAHSELDVVTRFEDPLRYG